MRVIQDPHAPGPAFTRSRTLRSFAAMVVVSCCMLAAAAGASAAPGVTIGGTPPLNDDAGTFTFTADGPALRLECSLDAFGYSQCSSPLPVSGLAAGPHTFRVRAIGLDNSVGIATIHNWTIDLVRPAVPVLLTPANNLLTAVATPTFSGTAEPNARVLIYDGSTQIDSAEVDGNGFWSFTPSAPLADGTHLWRARTLDPAGNRSDYTGIRTLRIDTLAPEAPAVSAPSEGAKLNVRTPVFAGTAEPGVTVAVMDGATRLCSTATAPSGDWTCTSSVVLSDGSYSVGISARDGAGNEGPATTRAFDLDATPPPAPAILTPADGLITTATTLTVSGTASPSATIKIFTGVDEMAELTAELDGSWSYTFDPVAEDDYVLSAREVDDFGNRSQPSNFVRARVDRTAPLASFQAHPAPKSNQSTGVFVLASGEPDSTFECALDSDDFEPCEASVSFPGLSEGTHTLKIRATDVAGNTGTPSSFTWQIDLTPPAIPSIEAPVDGATVTTAHPTFSGHADPGVSVEVFVGNSSIGTAPSATVGGAWALTPGSALAQGTLMVSVRAIDQAGNASAKTTPQTLRVDSIAPVTTITAATPSPSNAQTFSVAFLPDDPLAQTSCSLDQGAFLPCSSPYTSPVLAEGDHSLRVRSRDTAGNVESPAKTAAITIDRTAPVVQSSLIAGSAGSDGVPAFQIASDDPTATGRCKLDNQAFVTCAGRFSPGAASAGVHALTVRFTDPAGNSSDQVIPFAVTPTSTPVNPYEPPVAEPVCDVLGAAGRTTGRLALSAISGKQRDLRISLSASAAALARVDVTESAKSVASAAFALKAGTNRLAVRLRRAVPAGRSFEVAVRFYNVKREYGTARLAAKAASARYSRAAGARSRLETICPPVGGAGAKVKLGASGTASARSVTVTARGRQPALIALKVYRAGGSVPVADSLIALGPAPAAQKVKLISGVKLARGGYRLEYSAIAAGGTASSGRGAFLVR